MATILFGAVFGSHSAFAKEDPSAPQEAQENSSYPPQLEGTSPWNLSQPLDIEMVDGISKWAEVELLQANGARQKNWPRSSSNEHETKSWQEKVRAQVVASLGIQEKLAGERYFTELRPVSLPNRPTATEADQTENTLPASAAGKVVQASIVSWEVEPGLYGRALRIAPQVIQESTRADVGQGSQKGKPQQHMLLIPDVNWNESPFLATSERTLPGNRLLEQAAQIAASGVFVDVLMLIDRNIEFSGDTRVAFTDQTHREFLYRIGFELGRHLLGIEVDRARAWRSACSSTREDGDVECSILGIGQGGEIALLAGSVDSRFARIGVTGHFGSHEKIFEEPLDRNLWRQLSHFGDAELLGICDSKQVISVEEGSVSDFQTPPNPAPEGRRRNAPPSEIGGKPPGYSGEVERWRALGQRLASAAKVQFISGEASVGGFSSQFLDSMVQGLAPISVSVQDLEKANATIRLEREKNFREVKDYYTLQLHDSDRVRDQLWKNVDRTNVDNCVRSLEGMRALVREDLIGLMPDTASKLSPRSRKLDENESWVSYEVNFPVYEANATHPELIAGGVLLLPKNLQPGEKRPVVVCQHGLEGTPNDTITENKSDPGFAPYQAFASQLAKRGFIVYSPQNPYRGYDRFRVIQRKSNPLGRSLFSYIVVQHQQTLRWLCTLPCVDRDRLAFYGLSYGGKTAMRVPTMLVPSATEPGYCLSICSADFNEWVRKNATSHERFSYLFTFEYEIFEWNMGRIANYAELAYLMTPRPFMVERGHDDGVAPDEWVAWEFAKVKRHYDRLGIGDKTELEVFNGPHAINGHGTYRFLHRHLNWPLPLDPAK